MQSLNGRGSIFEAIGLNGVNETFIMRINNKTYKYIYILYIIIYNLYMYNYT